MKKLIQSTVLAAMIAAAPMSAFAQDATQVSANSITRIILSDRPVEKVLFPGDGRTQMMTLEEFRLFNPAFANAELNTTVPAGTHIVQPIG